MRTSATARSSLFTAAALLLTVASCSSAIRSRIYRPEPMPQKVSWSGRTPQDVAATTADGLRLRGYYWPPQSPGGDLIIFFHGQSGNAFAAATMAAPLAEGGGLLVASYRGYGDNAGIPDEAGLYSDASAFLALARTVAPASRIYLVGFSLGAAPALHTAAEEKVAGVATIGAFTSLRDMAPSVARPLLHDRFDNLATIARIDEPILILHAPADEVVPFAHAGKLQARAPSRVRLLRLEGIGHRPDFAALSPVLWENLRQMPH